MSRLSYKTLFIILLFLLIPIVFLFRINQKGNKVSATWWNDSWTYRQAISISNPSGSDLTDFQVSVDIGTSALIDSNKMQSDCDDIRITDQNGQVLSHWIEKNNSGCNALTDTKIWVKTTSLPSTGTTIFFYYGNPQANNIENGNNVFEFFDDFNDNQLDPSVWTNTDMAGALTSSETTGVYRRSGTVSIADRWSGISSNTIFNSTRITEGRIKVNSYTSSEFVLNFDNQGTAVYLRNTGTGYKWEYYSGGWTTIGNSVISTGGTAVNVKIVTTTANSNIYENDTLVGTRTVAIGDTGVFNTTLRLYNIGNSGSVDLDNVRIRKYASANPTTTPSTEELRPEEGINIGGTSIETPSGNLVAYYKFDEGYGTIANNSGIGGSSLNGIITNHTWNNNGKSNKAINFNGTNTTVTINNQSALNPSEISISSWVYITANPTNLGNVISKGGNSGYRYRINNDRTISFFDRGGTNMLTTTETIPLNQWSQIVATGNSSGINIYLNGKLSKSNSITYGSPITIDPLYIGWGYGSEYFNGLIDEVKIYNYALSSDEVKTDYNQSSSAVFSVTNLTVGNTSYSALYCIPGSTDPCSPPVAEWKFEEGVGTSTADTSGNGNVGTLANGPTWTSGKIGKGIRFDGIDDYIYTSNIDLLNNYSLSTWIYSKGTGGIIIVDQELGCIDYPTYKMSLSGGKITCQHFTSNATGGKSVTSNQTININNWYQANCTYNGSTLAIYINGVYDNSTAVTSSTWNSTRATTIAAGDSQGACGDLYSPINAIIDQIRIYNYARTRAQIAWDYNQGAPIGWWKFDECQGSIAHDSSGIGNTGVISIGASGTQNTLGTCQVGTSAAWTAGATGKFNSSLNFDGNDDKTVINDSDTLELKGPFTLSAWVKTVNSGGGAIISKLTTSPYDGWAFRIQSDGKLGTYLKKWVTGNKNVADQNWHLVNFIYYNNGTGQFFVDGQIDGLQQTGLITPTATTQNMWIGLETWSPTETPFSGQIDDVRIYNYALTSTQIKTLYNGGSVNFN